MILIGKIVGKIGG